MIRAPKVFHLYKLAESLGASFGRRDGVSGVLLTGSLGVPGSTPDEWSDIDLLVLVRDNTVTERLIVDGEIQDVYREVGNPINHYTFQSTSGIDSRVTFDTLVQAECWIGTKDQRFDIRSKRYRVIWSDGASHEALESFSAEKLVERYTIQFEKVIHLFWGEMLLATKKLLRDKDLLTVCNYVNSWIRTPTLEIVFLSALLNHKLTEFTQLTRSKWFVQNPESYERAMRLNVTGTRQELWDALREAAMWVAEVAPPVCTKLGVRYPLQLQSSILEYLNQSRA
jgi:hypothetical protein